ncbi:MAG: glycosyltransferase family 2 protein [Coleofasciculus sp. B1-GNL1-01]|uniref:glycosyltransferase family 2 protein n=1 Tax=Coleofasciculus sp. B1-GNL1-01 TaxID=3068484 RepID=UPI0032FFEF9E
MNRDRTAILITCHNRKPKTLACLDALFNQVLPAEVILDVYLVDDGSTDGTTEAVRQTYPQVKILPGDGNLYWNRGMHKAFAEALKHDYDYYLWLNDDTVLYPEAIASLLTTSHHLAAQGEDKAIVVGSMAHPETGKLTYGGLARNSWWHPFKYKLVEPGKDPQPVDTMNGNCVLIPRSVVQAVGNLNPAFTHSIGDIDYGLRAQQQGCTVWVAPGYTGKCQTNPPQAHAWLAPELTLRQRWQKANQIKGFPPAESKVFCQRHANRLWFFFWILPYVRLVSISIFGAAEDNKT